MKILNKVRTLVCKPKKFCYGWQKPGNQSQKYPINWMIDGPIVKTDIAVSGSLWQDFRRVREELSRLRLKSGIFYLQIVETQNDESIFENLDSSMKKNTTFVKKMVIFSNLNMNLNRKHILKRMKTSWFRKWSNLI